MMAFYISTRWSGRRGRLAVDIGVGLVRGGEGLDAGLAELAGVLAVLGREVTRTLVDDIEVELGEEVGDPLCVVVVWHGDSFPRRYSASIIYY